MSKKLYNPIGVVVVLFMPWAVVASDNPTTDLLAQARITDLTHCASTSNNDLYDDDGWNYGTNYLANNDCSDTPICFYTRVTIKENVKGSVHPGPLYLRAGERNINLGSFQAKIYGDAWRVNVQYQADDGCF